MNSSTSPTSNPSPTFAWIFLAGSLLYLVSPIDFVPDFPIIGHIDDVLVLLISTLNLAQVYLARIDATLAAIARTLKIIVIVLSVFVIGALAIGGAAIYQSFQ